ncbi:LuxR family transcriptional regulator [Pseudonocardia yunnanensis]|uniref:LuxR C-terminal-related transcriptional regulator n=1 Tax=Pseudonocardia yunnanensis TaxID=58107 RepID=A0ABW4EYU7_9PSEU
MPEHLSAGLSEQHDGALCCRGAEGNLPIELTSFVGRHNELAEARRSLGSARLVTLTGIGGVGKTRLALRAAEKVRRGFPDGVWLVELGELSDASLLVDVVAATLGVRAPVGRPVEDALVDVLADTGCLLVLDNCEQIVEAVAALSERVLRRCRRVRILCTSREELRTDGEVVLRVPTLTVPGGAGDAKLTDPSQSDAVALFVDRATAAVAGFTLTDGNAATVADICRRLDGLPLAIELAAARLRTLSPTQILERLADRFALLTLSGRGAPTRQQTLRLCMDWSHDLCTPAEQLVWSRLSYFAGTMDIDVIAAVCEDAVEAMCGRETGGPDELLDIVTSLVEKSILVREDSGSAPVRFRMLETSREYGRERSRARGDEHDVHERLSRWYEDLAVAAQEQWIGPRQLEWIARLEREQSNFRYVLDYCALENPQRGLRMAAALFPFWNSRALFSEGRHWLDRLLAQADGEVSAEVTMALHADIVLTASQGDLDAADVLVARAREIAESSEDPTMPGLAALADGTVALFRAECERAQAHLENAVRVLRAGGAPEQPHLSALVMLAFSHELQSAGHRAIRCFEDALEISRAHGESVYRSYILWGMGVSLWRSGRREDARARFHDGLRFADDIGHPLVAASCLDALAWIATEEGDARRAAVLLGAADALSRRSESITTFLPALLVHHRDCEQSIQRTLGVRAYSAAYRRGVGLASSGDVTAALESTTPPAPGPTASILPTDAADSPLTKRESEVAALIGRGLTNRAIAEKLVISQRTVHGHVEHILAKLNFSSRVQIAAWVVTHRASA